jgi:ABC-type glucose/galactose transport system permease subunit
MKILKKVVLWVMAAIGLLLALAGALIGYYMIHPAPLLSTLATLLLVIGLVSFALAFAEVKFDNPGAGMPTPERG